MNNFGIILAFGLSFVPSNVNVARFTRNFRLTFSVIFKHRAIATKIFKKIARKFVQFPIFFPVSPFIRYFMST